jgi:general secretion pathway protein D
MKIILIVVIFYFQVLANNLDNISLKDYITLVSKQQHITILIDENIDQKITILIDKNIKKDTYLKLLKSALLKKKLKLLYVSDYYIIQKLTPKDLKQIRFIKLKYIKYDDIKSLFTFYNIQHSYIPTSKTILMKSDIKDYLSIRSSILKFDKLPNQLKLKITILDTNLNNLKEYGINNEASISPGSNDSFFYNLVAYPFTVTNNIPSTDKNKFYSFIKLINQKGISKLVSSPILTLSDEKISQLDLVTNIAYSTGESVVNDENSKSTKSFQYKDVGLKISVKPTIYDTDTVHLEFDLNVDNIINGGDTPTVSKKHIKQNFHMKKNKLFILTGINRNEILESENGIPGLKDIPFLGWLFKYKSNTKLSSTLSIVLEIVDNNEIKKDLDLNKKQKQSKVKKEVIIKKIYNYPDEEKYIKAQDLKDAQEHQKRIKEIFVI